MEINLCFEETATLFYVISESEKSSPQDPDVTGGRTHTFIASGISKPDNGQICLLLVNNIFFIMKYYMRCIQVRISQLSNFKPLGEFVCFVF